VRSDQQEIHIPRDEVGVQEICGQPEEERCDDGPSIGIAVAKRSRVRHDRAGCHRSRADRDHDQSRLHAMCATVSRPTNNIL